LDRIRLDSSCNTSIFAHRSKSPAGRNLYTEPLADAGKIWTTSIIRPCECSDSADVQVVELDPSYVGHELKHATLLGARRYDEPILAFKGMLSKLDNIVNVQIRGML
jgi:hypothetical protein